MVKSYLHKFVLALILFAQSYPQIKAENEVKSFYADISTNQQGVHTMNMKIGSSKQPMRLLLHPDEYRMFIVDRRSDADFEKERTYDPTTS